MKKILAAILGFPVCLQAGGFERESQMPSYLFNDGKYAEFKISLSAPTVDGTLPLGPTQQETGDVFINHKNVRLAYKAPINNKLDWSLAYLESFGTDVAYHSSDSLYPLEGSFAKVDAKGLTALLKYKAGDRFSVYGGGKISEYQGRSDVNVTIPQEDFTPLRILDYQLRSEKDQSVGYVLGVAYEIPDIALRVALTYNSEVEHKNSIVESATGVDVIGGTGPFAIPDTPSEASTTLPSSINLSFQTGITPKTLLFGYIHWVDWTATEMTPQVYAQVDSGNSLIVYNDDSVTYDFGVGRRITDAMSMALSFRHEKSTGMESVSLSPTDGYSSLTLSALFSEDKRRKINANVTYVDFGDTYTDTGGQRTDFTNNDSLVFGLTFGFGF